MEGKNQKIASLLMIGLLLFGAAVVTVSAVAPGASAITLVTGSDCDNPRDEEEGLIPDECETTADIE